MDYLNPDYTAVFIERKKRLEWLREKPERFSEMATYYKDNIADFICDWGMTSDPRNADIGLPVVIPFILFPRQREWIDWLEERWRARESGLTEKCRDMGLSWLSIATASAICLFNKDLNIGFGSRKEEYVDKIGDPKSLFYKARQFLSTIPPEFSGGWDTKKHSSHMVIRFPNTGSTLTGEAGDNIGRGNRTAIYFKDESAFYERPELIDAALSQTSNCKIDISTPNGPGNPFYHKRFAGNISVFTFSWREDPRKDDAWYAKQEEELDPAVLAQEVDIDYMASIEGVTIPGNYVKSAINAHKSIGFQAEGTTRVGFDVADEQGKDSNVVIAVKGSVVDSIETWKGSDTHQSTNRAYGFASQIRAAYINYDSIGVGAGVRASSKAMPIKFNAVATSESPTSGRVLNNPDRANKDFYLNLRAQLWWEMRIRFERTYQHVNDIKKWSAEDMISIPNDPQLIMELSQPLYDYTNTGKIKIEGKKELAKRGIASPNYADAFILAFAKATKSMVAAQQPQTMGGWV